MDQHFRAILFLLSTVALATALPLSDLDELLPVEASAQKQLTNGENVMKNTTCSSEPKEVDYYIGNEVYIFYYRACLDRGKANLMCYDSRETLPMLCPAVFHGDDCTVYEWETHNSTIYIEICDWFGRPCQKRIPGLERSNPDGECRAQAYLSQHATQTLNGLDEISDMQKSTGCSTRSRRINYYIGNQTFIYKYKACLNHDTEVVCYDSTQNLPVLCPQDFQGSNCTKYEWYVSSTQYTIQICTEAGGPCQKPIPGLRRSDSNRQCGPMQSATSAITFTTSKDLTNKGRVY